MYFLLFIDTFTKVQSTGCGESAYGNYGKFVNALSACAFDERCYGVMASDRKAGYGKYALCPAHSIVETSENFYTYKNVKYSGKFFLLILAKF